MAHELNFKNGQASMAYYGQAPWHGLGKRLARPMTSEQAWREAQLDFDVWLEPMFTASGINVPGRFATVRSDTQAVLGVVSDQYQPIQNSQAFGFLDALVAEGQLEYHTAGALGQGERVWMLAKLPRDIVVKGDLSQSYLLLSNSHDGSQALRTHWTSVRVVCNNTLTQAANQAGTRGAWIQHRGNLAGQFQDAQAALGLAQTYFDDLEARINKLAQFYPTATQVREFFEALYPDPKPAFKPIGWQAQDAKAQEGRAAKKTREALTALFEGGLGNTDNGIKHTGWAMVNAVTEFIDHAKGQGGGGEARDRRMKNVLFEDGAKVKAQAFDMAVKLADAGMVLAN